ncbi:MAG TPA: excisionase family DNA-binding protein [Gemmatimonadales bacterium]|nr:excisionase family DNA-binding protein [Gemmatimonadales bacterium]
MTKPIPPRRIGPRPPQTPTPIAPVRGRLFGARAAAEYLGVTTSKVRQLIRRGELVAVRTSTGRLEGVYETDCEAWITAHRQAVSAPTPTPKQLAVDERMKLLMPAERRFR